MNRAWLVCAALALGTHALLLFAFHPGPSARPRPLAEESSAVEIDVVEAAPEAAASMSVPPEPEPAPPPPEPMPEPVREPMPDPIPAPAPSKTTPRPEVKNQRVTVANRLVATPAASSREGVPKTPSGRGPSTGARPRYRSNPKPDYPPEARRAGQQGAVMIAVEVTAEGRAANVQLSRSSGFPLLDAAALQAVRRWTFEPARIAGIPIASRVEVPVRFDLAR